MQAPTVAAERQQGEVWPLQAHPPGQLHLGQVQSLDAFVASMELQPADSVNLGFMCGSLPVPTCSLSDIGSCNSSSSANNGDSEAALIPAFGLQSQRAAAPRYRVLPTETDLNMPPTDSFQADPIFPVSATQEAAGSCKAWAGSYLSQPLARKCEALAVNALAGYGDEIDVVAPVDILKQLFKIPYCKARLSLAVHRIGHTLILNSGPDQWRDDRPGVKLPSQKKSHAQMMERALFSKFVQHSMNGDSCGSTSPPDSDSQSSTSTFGFEEFDDHELQQRSRSRMASHRKGKTRVSLGHYRHNRCEARFETVQKKRYAGEQQRETEFVQKECPADGPQRPHDNYLRVLFWQFENLRMLLGSDLLLFSNENHSAVSLHLLEIERQVTPLMWLDAWLDNVMASIPELAVCYHRNGVVQGYELLKTDDIFLVKGLAEDGSTVFHPHVIQKNASTVLRFLQDNCKQDPGTYWLLKNSGEDLMQLFDLSVISKTCSPHTDKDEKSDGTLPSTRSGCREQYSLPLAMLLYRLTHRLSLSQDPADSLKCAKLFGKCLEFMEEQEHLIIRASAHEHMARLILTSFKKIGSILAPLLLESSTTEGAVVTETKQPVLKLHSSVEEAARDDIISATSQIQPSHGREISTTCSTVSINPCTNGETTSLESTMAESKVEDNGSLLQKSLESRASQPEELSVEQALESSSGFQEVYNPNSVVDHNKALGFVAPADTPPKALLALTDPVSARLAAVHHISQAIKALRWQRQLDIGEHPIGSDSTPPKHPSHGQQFPLCICGEAECVAICDFREIAAGAQMDQKLWRLMLLLGEGYLSLGEAYKDQGQLNRAMKAAELACLVCGAMPPGSENTTDDSLPENNSPAYQKTLEARSSSGKACELKDVDGSSVNRSVRKARGRQQGLFWGRVWMFVGDVYVEIQRSVGEGDVTSHKQGSPFEELTMPREVMKEVKRLKKKIGQLRGSCGMCSLTSCSCQSDRASSGESASSCNSSIVNSKYGRRVNKTGNSKSQHKVSGDIVSESKSNVGENWGRSAREHSDSGRDTKREDREKVNGAPHGLVKSGTTAAKLLTAQSKTEKVLKLKGNVGESGRRSEKEPSDSGRDIDKEARNGLAASGNTAAKLLTAQPKVENVQGKGHSDPSDIFSYLRRPMTVDWESNLSAAGECYAMAIMAFGGFSECSQHLESALRKKGWAYNELGRRRLSHGLAKLAEVAFATAVEAFRAVKDAVNVVLVHCNLGHGKRAAAEALAAKLSAWRDCDFLPLYVQTIAEAKFLYGEALKFYGMARLELLGAEDDVRASMGELLGAEDDVRASMRGLWTEVHTQLAHTYLRLGMLLAKEDNIVYACRKSNAERRLLGNGGGGDKMLSGVKDATPTKDAITKALELYKSMGDLRAQEAAFAQFQLACHHRDSCQSAALQGDVVLKKAETSSFQKAKLHLSLAELYWQKALEFYQPEPHVDMFLDILVERSALCLVMATSFHQNQMTEQALNFLLEGRRAFVSDAIDCSAEKTQAWNAEKHHAKPSAETVEKLTKQLQMLLKTMLAAAVQSSRLSSNAGNLPRGQKSNGSVVQGDMQSGPSRPDDVEKLKQMYRVALQSARKPNLDLLFNLWVR